VGPHVSSPTAEEPPPKTTRLLDFTHCRLFYVTGSSAVWELLPEYARDHAYVLTGMTA
jgi:hypothetical protein